jgi:hypothetical protein
MKVLDLIIRALSKMPWSPWWTPPPVRVSLPPKPIRFISTGMITMHPDRWKDSYTDRPIIRDNALECETLYLVFGCKTDTVQEIKAQTLCQWDAPFKERKCPMIYVSRKHLKQQ